MASTRPTSEQLRFTSSKTGEHSLDTYMENAEIGNTTLANLLAQAFDTSGQFKTGFADYKGDFATSTLYDPGDVYREASSEDLYVVRVQHTSTNVAADLAANKTTLILDASTVNTAATNAANSATASASSATSAATANTNAQTAKTAAETAQAAAETAQAASASSSSSASSSASTATTKASEASASAAAAAASAASAGVSLASQAEAEAGTDNTNQMTPLRTKQAVDAYGLLSANNLSDVASASTARTNLGLGTAATLTAGTSANNAVQLDGSAALPAVSGANLTNLPASGGTVDLVADGAITAGKPVAITPDGKVKQISATGYTMTESIGSTVATSSRNSSVAHLVYDEGNDEVLSGINISGNMYFARVTLDASMNTAYTGELTYAHGGSDAVAGIGMVYNPVIDRIWSIIRGSSNTHGYLLRNNSGTLSGSASDSFGSSAAYGSVDVNPATGAMYISATASATTGESGVGFADTSISEVVKAHNTTDLHTGAYGQSYCYYSGFRHIPDVGLIHMRYLYDYGIEFQFLTSEQWNKDQAGAYNSSSLTGGTIARYSQAPTNNSVSHPDRTVQVVTDSGTGQRFYCATSQWHPWAKRLIMPGRARTGAAHTISTISFANAMADMSYGVGLADMSYLSYHGPHFVPIPNTNAFIVVYYDTTDSNKLVYRTIDIKLGRTASEDDFVVSASRQIDTNSNSNCCAIWDQNRNAMVVSAKHSSEQRFYGVKPQLGVSNARSFIGFASSTVSDTQTLTVHLKGAVNENQSSLVTGRRYLVGHDGNLIEADNNPGKSQGMPFVGTAISATKIMVGA